MSHSSRGIYDLRLLISVGMLLLILATAYFWGRSDEKQIWVQQASEREKQLAEQLVATKQRMQLIERKSVSSMAVIADQLLQQKQDSQDEKDRLLAGFRAGTLRLSVPVRASVNSCQPSTSARAPGGNAATRAELSEEAGEFLIRLATEADDVVRQLSSCQSVIKLDREMLSEFSETVD